MGVQDRREDLPGRREEQVTGSQLIVEFGRGTETGGKEGVSLSTPSTFDSPLHSLLKKHKTNISKLVRRPTVKTTIRTPLFSLAWHAQFRFFPIFRGAACPCQTPDDPSPDSGKIRTSDGSCRPRTQEKRLPAFYPGALSTAPPGFEYW